MAVFARPATANHITPCLEQFKKLCKQGSLMDALGNLYHFGDRKSEYMASEFLLQSCVDHKRIAEGKCAQAFIILRGLKPNIFLGNTILNLYSKCGFMKDARKVFDEMPQKNVTTWTMLIRGYANNGLCDVALQLFGEMRSNSITPNLFTFSCLVPLCPNLETLKRVHSEILDIGLLPDLFLGCALVDKYAKFGAILDARHVFDKMPKPDMPVWNAMIAGYARSGKLDEAFELHRKMPEKNPASWNSILCGYLKYGLLTEALNLFWGIPNKDVVCWTAMISGYVRNGVPDHALEMFRQMRRDGICVNSSTMTAIGTAVMDLEDFEIGREFHSGVIRYGFDSDVFVGSSLVAMYSRFLRLTDAEKVFMRMPRKDAVVWNAMISGYMESGNVDKGREMFTSMPNPDVASWTTMIAGYAKNGHLQEASALFDKMPSKDIISWNAMITAFAKNGMIDEASKLFNMMPEKNVLSWNTLIAGYVQTGEVEKASLLFEEMPSRDIVSWNTVISGYAQSGNMEEALKLMDKMPTTDIVTWNSILTGFLQNGYVDRAFELFQKMSKRDVVSWNTMMGGYAQNGLSEEALRLFCEMHRSLLVIPNAETFAIFLAACADLALLEQGIETHGVVHRLGLHKSIKVGNALLDMYAKCGSIGFATKVFSKMQERNLVSWTNMVGGFAMNGLAFQAIEMFDKMIVSGIKPDRVSFIAILSACCHAGLVDKGYEYFQKISREYNVQPTLEHYGCIVDLLGRAGCLDDAYKFIMKMPIHPDSSIWGSFLNACRMYDNVQLGELAAKHLFELDSNNPAPYVAL